MDKVNNKKIKFNGMDLCICIVMVAVLAAALVFAKSSIFGSGGGKSTNAENTDVTITVELTGTNENVKDAIAVGDVVSVGEKDKVNFTVSNVVATPAKITAYNIEKGEVLNSEIPEEYDVKIDLTAPGTETDRDITVDNYAVRVGKAEALSSKGWVGYGYTIGVNTSAK